MVNNRVTLKKQSPEGGEVREIGEADANFSGMLFPNGFCWDDLTLTFTAFHGIILLPMGVVVHPQRQEA